MSSETNPPRRKAPILALGAAALALAAIAWFAVARLHLHPMEVKDRVLAAIRSAGPVPFFAAMAVLPAVGFPLLGFTVPAGEVFSPRMGLGWVIALSLAAVVVDLALAYWLARFALRPTVARMLERYGYKVPAVSPANALSVALVVRLTPGPPYSLQCYLLGLAEVPFRTYMVVSFLCLLPWVIGAIVLGEGVLNGNFKVAVTGVAVLGGAVWLVHRLRRKYASGPQT